MKRILLAFLIAFLALASTSEAAFRLYIVPIVGSGHTSSDPRRPKYFQSDALGNGSVGIITSNWGGVDYGLESWMAVGVDLSFSDDLLIVGEPDVFSFPFDLATNLSSADVIVVQSKLDSINLPSMWIDTTNTWLEVVRSTLGMFSLMQRFSIYNGNSSLFSGVNLNSTMNTLPAQTRANLIAAAQSFGLDTSTIIDSTKIRDAMKIIADQMTMAQYNFNGVLL